MSIRMELRDEDQQKTFEIFVNEQGDHEIMVNGNLALATKLLEKHQEKENFKRAFQIISNPGNIGNVQPSSSKSPVALLDVSYSETQHGSNNYFPDIDAPAPVQDNNKIWSHEATLMLIHLCQKYENDFETGVKKYVWTKVARELTERFGLEYTIQQCDTKWKGLKNTYKAVKKHNEQSGNNKKEWKYFDLLDNILFARPEIQAPATCSARTGLRVSGERVNIVAEGTSRVANLEPQDENRPTENNTPQSTSGYRSSFMRKRKTVENAAERRHREKMVRQDRYLDLLERLTTAVERNAPARQDDVA